MTSKTPFLHYITFSLVLVALIAKNLLTWHNPTLGIILTVVYLLFYGRRLGAWALPKFNSAWQTIFGPLFLLAGLAVLGSIVYYIYALTNPVIIALALFFPLSFIPYCYFTKKKIDKLPEGPVEKFDLVEAKAGLANLLGCLALIGDAFLIYYLYKHGTAATIQSPWQMVSLIFFQAFFITTFFLLMFIRQAENTTLALLAVSLHCFLILSVAVLIYKMGFGFDPFIHRASEKFISQFGAITPKTPYYIGQYVLVIFLSKLSLVPLSWIDRLLLPALEAAFIPPLAFLTLRQGLGLDRPQARLGSLLFFLIPVASMIATTPQDLANFFALAVIFFGALHITTKLIPLWIPLIFTAAALVTHPLTGLPLVVFVFFLILLGRKKAIHPLMIAAGTIIFWASLLILPAIFVLILNAQYHWPVWIEVKDMLLNYLPHLRPGQPFSIGPTLLYIYEMLLPLFVIILSFFGGWLLWEKREENLPVRQGKRLAILCAMGFLIFIFNAALLRFTIQFANIGYAEQTQYPGRLYNFAFYLLMPIFLYGAVSLIKKGVNFVSFLIYLGIAALLTASFYLSYPRVDAYAFSRYFNTSANDIIGAREIDLKSDNEDYIVLANTSFSAAGIREFGFKKYFSSSQGDLFYYSLPTGGPLYGFYEDMVYRGATRETMLKAMDLAGVNLGYLVIHNYWNSFKTAAPQAKLSAGEWWPVAGGKIFIFKYKR